MVSTTPRKHPGLGVKKKSDLSEYCPLKPWLSLFMYVYQSEITESSPQDLLFIFYILVKEEPYTVPLGMDFQLNLPKPVKK